MKVAESKTSTTAQQTQTSRQAEQPFFQRQLEGGQSAFFGQQSAEQSTPFFQPKLKIGAPNDHYEQQADAVADKVVAKLNDTSSKGQEAISKGQSANSDVQRSVSSREVSTVKTASTAPLAVQTKCAACEAEEKKPQEDIQMLSSGEMQRKPIFDSAADPTDDSVQMKPIFDSASDDKLQMKSEGGDTEGSASSGFESQLASTKGGGSALPSETQQQMGSAIGADFSGVRVHSDSNAAKLSDSIGAQAFAHGNDVYFNEGKYNPSTTEGSRLLAHELTHTVQQGAAKSSVQKKTENILQKAPADKKAKIPIKEAKKKDFDAIKTMSAKGQLFINDEGKLEFQINNFVAKGYVERSDTAWLTQPIKIPRSASAIRSDAHRKNWKDAVKAGVTDKVDKNLKANKIDSNENLRLTVLKNDKTGVIGSKDQIIDRILVPFWEFTGDTRSYDVEHVVDLQIGGNYPGVNDTKNLFLLDSSINRAYGAVINKEIQDNLEEIADFYRKDYFTGIPKKGSTIKARFDVTINRFKYQYENFGGHKLYYEKEDIADQGRYNPYKISNVTIAKASIPKHHFLFKTSEQGLGYILPYKATKKKVGAWLVTVVLDGDEKIKSLKFELEINPKNKKPIVVSGSKLEGGEASDIVPTEMAEHTYVLSGDASNKLKGQLNYVMQGIKFNHMSPVKITETNIEGVSVMVKGKVISDLSILKDVDINFAFEDGNFSLSAEVPLNQIAKNIPKPFKVNSCSLLISASSIAGFTIAGQVSFSIEKLGEGEITVGFNSDKGIFFDGEFNFNSKWFEPALVSFNYEKGEWSIGGKIGIKKGLIPGIKDATLEAQYAKGAFAIAGIAHVNVPGIDEIRLAAQFDEKGNFAFTAGVDLKEMKGIKSGKVTVTVTSKEGDDIKLRVEGKASPDLPKVPKLTSELDVLYDNGIFKVSGTVRYQEGRFDGTITAGVTNQQVDDKGNPQGAPNEAGEVFIFGFGSLTVDLYKNKVKGTVSVRVTPEKEVFIGGKIVANNLKPFGEGYHPKEKELLKFPTIEIPLIGIPGLSISAFVGGGVYFKFSWDPLVLKQLSVEFKETNINELDKAQFEIKGSVGSIATAEVYMAIEAGIKGRALIAVLTGKLGGEAGLGVTAEAGGDIAATMDLQKGLQLKEIGAHLDVTPKAMFRLTGGISVDLDLWVTSVNLYEKKWVLAEQQIDMGALTLKAGFQIKFDEEGNVIPPDLDKIDLQKPNFDGDAGKAVLDKGINGDAEKELEAKKQEIRDTVKHDLRDSTDPDFSPSTYTKKMKKKYAKSPELQEFVVKTIEEESRLIEYEEFDKLKNRVKELNIPLANKMPIVSLFGMFFQYVTEGDIAAFKAELIRLDEERKLKEAQEKEAAAQAAEQAKREQLAQQEAQKQEAAKAKRKGKKPKKGGKPKNAKVQLKLKIGAPNDRFEQEADAVADQVVKGKEQEANSQGQEANGKGQTATSPVEVQRKPIFDSNADADVQMKCAACEEEDAVQRAAHTDLSSGTHEGGTADSSFESSLASSKGSGSALPTDTRQKMESGIGADFSGVRVHTGSEAAQLSDSIGAQAFTHGNDVYFNEGKYNPSTTEGAHLLAHELTHTVQQGAAVKRKTDEHIVNRSSAKPMNPAVAALHQTNVVQRNFFSTAWNMTGGKLVDAAGAVIEFGEDLFWEAVEHFGGRSLVDTLRTIQREGPLNFFKTKLLQAVNGIFDGLQNQSGKMSGIFPQFGQLVGRMRTVVNALAAGDCAPLFAALNDMKEVVSKIAGEAWDAIVEFFQPAIDFFKDVWEQIGLPVIEWLKAKAAHVWNWIQQVGKNIWNWFKPVRDAVSKAWDWLKGIIGLNADETGEEGLIQWAQHKAEAAWEKVKEQLKPIIEPARQLVAKIKAIIPLSAILNLRKTIQDWLKKVVAVSTAMGSDASNLENEAQQVSLRDQIIPAVQQSIERFKGTLMEAAAWVNDKIGAVFSAVGDFFSSVRSVSFLNIASSVINWVETKTTALNEWAQSKVTALFESVGNGLSKIGTWLKPILDTLKKVFDVLGDLLGKLPDFLLGPLWQMLPQCLKDPIKKFIIEQILNRMPFFQKLQAIEGIWEKIQNAALVILKKVFVDGDFKGALWTFYSTMLGIIGIPPQLVTSVISKAAQNLIDILEDPLGFLGNFIQALKTGFNQFFGNIWTHLLSGMQAWLFGQLQGTGIEQPTDFSFKSMLKLAFEILGITIDMIATQIQKVFPEKRGLKAKILTWAARFAKVWDFFVGLLSEDEEGGTVWDRLEKKIGNIWDMILDGVAGWLESTIVKKALAWVATKLDPTGVMAVITTIIDVFNVIQAVADKAREILEIINGVLDGIADLIKGVIAAAADFFEKALAAAIPVVLTILAYLFGLDGAVDKIKEVIKDLREKVEQAVENFVRKLRSFVERLVAGVKDAVDQILSLLGLKYDFTTESGESHKLYMQESGSDLDMIVESNPKTIGAFLTFYQNQYGHKAGVSARIATIKGHINTMKEKGYFKKETGNLTQANITEAGEIMAKIVNELKLLMVGNKQVGKTIESYLLEGISAPYGQLASPRGDTMDKDHQPQFASLDWAASKKFMTSKGKKRLQYSRGQAILLYHDRHKLGATHSKGFDSSTYDSQLNALTKPEDKRKKIAEILKSLANRDADEINTQLSNSSAWDDINTLDDNEIAESQTPVKNKAELISKVKNNIKNGEKIIKSQSFDEVL